MRSLTIARVGDDGEPGQPLPGLLDLEWSNSEDEGGGRLSYSLEGPFRDVGVAFKAKEPLAILVDGEVVSNGYIELQGNGRTVISPTTTGRMSVWGFTDLRHRFDECIVYPGGDKVSAKDRRLVGTPNDIMAHLFDEAHDRGALSELTKDFTASVDSHGVPFDNDTLYDLIVPVGTKYGDLLRLFAGDRNCEWIVRKRVFRMFVYGGRGVDWELEDPEDQIVLRAGRDIYEEQRNSDPLSLANAILAVGDEGRYGEHVDSGSITEFLRRERYFPMSGIKSPDRLDTIATALTNALKQPLVYRTYALQLQAGRSWDAPQPYEKPKGFEPGDRVGWSDGDSAVPTIYAKVANVTLKRDANSILTCLVAAEQRFLSRGLRVEDRLARIQGDLPGGVRPTRNVVPPAPPTGLVMTQFLDPPGTGPTMARLHLVWVLPTKDGDGASAALDDLNRMEVHWQYDGDAHWNIIRRGPTQTTADIPDVIPAAGINVEVYAVDDANNYSDPLEGSTTNAEDTGGFRATDLDGNLIMRTRDGVVEVYRAFEVEAIDGTEPGGFGLDAAGPGLRIAAAEGAKFYGDGGTNTIDLSALDGSATFTGDLIIGGDVTATGGTFTGGTFNGGAFNGGTFDGGTITASTFATDGGLSIAGGTISFSGLTLSLDGGDLSVSGGVKAPHFDATGYIASNDTVSAIEGFYSVLGGLTCSSGTVTCDHLVEVSMIGDKEDFRAISDPVSILRSIRGYDYARVDGGRREFGFIAEEHERAGHEWALGRHKGDGSLSGVRYTRWVPVHHEVLIEHEDRLDAMERRIKRLEHAA